MWWPNRLTRLCAVLALAGLTAGCFQPLYGEQASVGGPAVTRQAEQRRGRADRRAERHPARPRRRRGAQQLIYDLTGGRGAAATNYKLDIRLSSSQMQVIVDINTARPDIQNYGIDATYTLTDIATGKKVVSGQTFSRVSYNIPGQQQRFAGERGLRDAENRAAKVIADNIHSRLASYFVAGT